VNPFWNHQQLAIDKGDTIPNLAMFMEVGTGKTRVLIEIIRRDFNKWGPRDTLIVAPLMVCPQWKKEFAKHTKIPEQMIHVLVNEGAKRVKAMERILESGKPAIVITNYEGMRIEKFHKMLLKWGPKLVGLDESHRIKDDKSLQASRIYPLCEGAARRFLLTGTPILNSLIDIFGQYKALDPSVFGDNAWKFKRSYFYDKNAGRPNCNFPDWQPLPNTLKDISAKIAPTSVQAKKEDCLDLPPLLKVPVPVPMSPQQEKLYEDMRKHFVAGLGETIAIAEFAMTKTLRLQQILTGYVAADSESDPAWVQENPRLDMLGQILEDLRGEQVLIWTNFRPTYKKIAERCAKHGYKVGFITGDETVAEKQAYIQAFIDGGIGALIINPAAGGAGLDGLQCCRYSIYYSRGYSLEHFLQSEGRNYRGGTKDKVTHYHLIVEGTLDEVIYKALANKQSVADEVLAWASQLRLTTECVGATAPLKETVL
jgi:SNF2 family DNA or RNA helicase